jgi:RNA polymerase sigma-70 factor (ECF subfamily)
MIAAAKITYLQERIARYDDQFAYKELFVAFYKPLLLFATSFVKSREQAEEIVSDVFIAIWEKRKRIETVSNLKVYLYVAAKNTAINYLSRQNKITFTSIDEIEPDCTGINLNPEQLMITAEMVHRIKMAIEQLPPQCRIIFKLVKEDGLKYREAAEVLDISVKTVENQVSIAIKRIGQAVNFDLSRAVSSPSRPIY